MNDFSLQKCHFFYFLDILNAFSITTMRIMRQIGILVLKYIWENKGSKIVNKSKNLGSKVEKRMSNPSRY